LVPTCCRYKLLRGTEPSQFKEDLEVVKKELTWLEQHLSSKGGWVGGRGTSMYG
jgi:hypothetical protein